MGTYNALDLTKRRVMEHVYGNACIELFEAVLPIGAAAAETIDFARLPKNIQILDFYERHPAGNSAATTANFGLASVPGGSTTLADEDYFLAAAALNAAGRNRWGNTAVGPVILDDDYFLRAVLAGTTSAGAAIKISCVLTYKFIGNL